MSDKKEGKNVIQVSDDEDIDLLSLSDLGLNSPPGRGDSCSYEGEYTCGSLGLVLKCVDGKWRSTNRSC